MSSVVDSPIVAPAPRHSPGKHLRFFLLWVALFCFGLFLYRHRYILIDDPYITFQYARNLVYGHGLVFNPGDRVEGYSNFVWLWVAAFFIATGWDDPLVPVQGVSILLAVGLMVWWCVGIGGRWRGSDGRRLGEAPFAVILLAFSYPWSVWAWGGLETIQYSVCVFASAVWSARCIHRPGRFTSWTLGGLLILTILSRPEGFLVLLFPAMALVYGLQRGKSMGALWKALVFFGAVFVVYQLFRLVYFGTLVPNTVSAKVGGGLFSTIWNGSAYLLHYMVGSPLVMLALAVVGLLGIFWRWTKRTETESDVLLVMLMSWVVLQSVFVVAVGGDWMPGMRFMVPLIPALCFVAGRQLEFFPRFVPVCLMMFFFLSNVIEARGERIFGYYSLEWLRRSAQYERTTISLQRVGEELKGMLKPTETLALSEVGVIPYYARCRVIDMLGLVDREIAQMEGGLHENHSAEIVLGRRPEAILLIAREDVERPMGLLGEFSADREMLAHPDFASDYRETRRWPRKLMNPNSMKIIPGHFILYERVDRLRGGAE